MCGLNFCTIDPETYIPLMNEKISYRGIRSNWYVYDDLGFGHVRLPIQGVDEKYDQPFEYKNWIILYVGEIFNYKKIDPTANSDIEVLAKSWDLYGEGCFHLFDGFWSVVVYDKQTGETHVFTDFLAKKPLYIHKYTSSVSSEIKSLCPFNGYKYWQDEYYFSCVNKWGYCLNEHTFISSVRKIPPCTHLVIKNMKVVSEKRYMGISPRKIHLREKIETAVYNRLVSDIPISLVCSGGLDSSIIYKLVEKKTHDFTIFHIDNKEGEYLNYLKIPGDINVVMLSLDQFDLNEVLYYNEGPVDLGSVFPQYEMASAIAGTGLSVALSGDGADELFGGYTRISDYDSQWSDVFEELVYYHLPRLDKLMMAKTIELRCPYLSEPVIAGALSLPYKDRMKKKILKEMFSDILPKQIIERDKVALKSKMVLEGGLEWRYYLVNKFRAEVFNEY